MNNADSSVILKTKAVNRPTIEQVRYKEAAKVTFNMMSMYAKFCRELPWYMEDTCRGGVSRFFYIIEGMQQIFTMDEDLDGPIQMLPLYPPEDFMKIHYMICRKCDNKYRLAEKIKL